MYCILVTGIPASGKTTMAKYLAGQLGIPLFSKDKIKELLYDSVGFRSREEKVRLGIASMNIMYETARQLMKCGQPFILENNFENLSKEGLTELLETYSYTAITVSMTGDYKTLYQRFIERNSSPDRHRGHVVNTCYPEKEGEPGPPASISYEQFVGGITERGMDVFNVNGPRIVVDTTELGRINQEEIVGRVRKEIEGVV